MIIINERDELVDTIPEYVLSPKVMSPDTFLIIAHAAKVTVGMCSSICNSPSITYSYVYVQRDDLSTQTKWTCTQVLIQNLLCSSNRNHSRMIHSNVSLIEHG